MRWDAKNSSGHRVQVPGTSKGGQVLVLGHADVERPFSDFGGTQTVKCCIQASVAAGARAGHQLSSSANHIRQLELTEVRGTGNLYLSTCDSRIIGESITK